MLTIPNVLLNDGNRIPQLGFGVWQVSTRQIVPVVSTALEAGYRHIDTAAAYGNEHGVGQAIRESAIPRHQLYVTTKLDNSDQGHARHALEDSLAALGLDYVDLYLIHWPVPDKRAESWRALEAIKAGDCQLGMIPVENSIAGRMADVHHLLPSSGLKIRRMP